MFRETWIEAESPRRANLILSHQFEHEDVEDPSQGFLDWDSPPTYDEDVNDKDPIEEPLATDLEEESEEYGLHPIFGSLYPDKDDPLEKKSPQMTSPIMKRLMKAFQVRCLIVKKKRLSMWISFVLKIF